MKKRNIENLSTPISALIDVVFQLIIFFVVTASVEKEIIDESIMLAQARYVQSEEQRDPRTITINLHKDGSINIAMQPLSPTQLQQILTAAVYRSGNSIPVVIRSDSDTLFSEIDHIMQVVGRSGLYRIQLAAFSEN